MNSRWMRFLRSIKLGLVLLVAIIVFSTWGSLMPLAQAQQVIYHSWWFILLLLVFTVNVSLASWHTWTVTIPGDARPIFLHKWKPFSLMPSSALIDQAKLTEAKTNRILEAVSEYFTRNGFILCVQDKNVAGMKGIQSRYGALVTHLGILALAIGSLIVFWGSVRGYVRILEGKTTNEFVDEAITGNPDNWTADGKLKEGVDPWRPLGGEVIVLDFEKRDSPSGMAQVAFISHVQIEEDGKTRSGNIEVNHLEIVGGHRLHQSSYGPASELGAHLDRYLLGFDYTDGGKTRRVTAELNLGETWPFNDGDEISLVQNGTALEARVKGADGSQAVFPLEGVTAHDHDAPAAMPPHGAMGGASAAQGADPHGGSAMTGHGDMAIDPTRPIEIDVVDFLSNLKVQGGKPYSPDTRWDNPAIQLAIYQDGAEATRTWLYYREELRSFSMSRDLPYTFVCVGVFGDQPIDQWPSAEGLDLSKLRPRVEVRNKARDDALMTTLDLTPGVRARMGGAGASAPDAANPAAGDAPDQTPADQDLSAPGDPGTQRASQYELVGFEPTMAYYTQLSVTKIPGMGFIYLGCLLMSLGPVIAFFSRHRWLQVCVNPSAGQVYIGGRSKHAKDLAAEEVEALKALVEDVLAE